MQACRRPACAPPLPCVWVCCSPVFLAGATHPNLTLSVDAKYIDPELLTDFSRCFPGFTGLSVGTRSKRQGAVELPPPTQLPGLRHLTVRWVATWRHYQEPAPLWPSVARYLPQLDALTIKEQPPPLSNISTSAPSPLYPRQHQWAAIFTPQHTTNTLTRLTVAVQLQAWLVRLLQAHTPALRELGVDSVCAQADAQVAYEPVCSWTVLRVPCMPMGALEWLPMPSHGHLTIAKPHTQPRDDPIVLEVTLPLSDKVS